MGTTYDVNGSVTLRDCPEPRAILEQLDERFDILRGSYCELLDNDDGTVTLNLWYGEHMSYGSVTDFDELLDSLGPFAVEPARFDTDCGGERGEMWIGHPGDVERAMSKARKDEAVLAFKQLSPDEQREVLTRIKELMR